MGSAVQTFSTSKPFSIFQTAKTIQRNSQYGQFSRWQQGQLWRSVVLERPTYNRDRSNRYIRLPAAVPRGLLFTQRLEHNTHLLQMNSSWGAQVIRHLVRACGCIWRCEIRLYEQKNGIPQVILLCVAKKWKCRTLLPLHKTLFWSCCQELKFCNFYNCHMA